MKKILLSYLAFLAFNVAAQEQLKLNDQGYFQTHGLDVTVFSDYYPDGHQSGVTIIQHGNRLAARLILRR